MVSLLRNKIRRIWTVLRIPIGIAAVICVVASGNAGQARVQPHLNNLGDNFVWIEAGGRAVNLQQQSPVRVGDFYEAREYPGRVYTSHSLYVIYVTIWKRV
jgi:ABC-type antimicrobial peptide transport system permease subunit